MSDKDMALAADAAPGLRPDGLSPCGSQAEPLAADQVSPGCVGHLLRDGRAFEVDLNDDHHSPGVLMRAAEMAYHRGGGTHPISDYDIRIAKEEITGEADEVAFLRRELRSAQAEIVRLTTASAMSAGTAESEGLRAKPASAAGNAGDAP